MRSRANWADHRKVHEGVVIACRNLLADSQVPRKRCCGAAWAGFFFNRRFSQRGRAATKRGNPAETRRRGGRLGGDFLDGMYRIDRMGGSASSDWMGGV